MGSPRVLRNSSALKSSLSSLASPHSKIAAQSIFGKVGKMLRQVLARFERPEGSRLDIGDADPDRRAQRLQTYPFFNLPCVDQAETLTHGMPLRFGGRSPVCARSKGGLRVSWIPNPEKAAQEAPVVHTERYDHAQGAGITPGGTQLPSMIEGGCSLGQYILSVRLKFSAFREGSQFDSLSGPGECGCM